MEKLQSTPEADNFEIVFETKDLIEGSLNNNNAIEKIQQPSKPNQQAVNNLVYNNSQNVVALMGPNAVQVLDNSASLFHKNNDTPTDLRQLVCAFFIDSILASVPKARRKNAQKEIADVMQRLRIVSADYFSEAFAVARRPLSLFISKFVIQACQQGPSVALSPGIDSSISVNGLSLVNSRYLSDFKEIALLGSGGFGKVFKVRSLVDNQMYAIKKICFNKSSSDSFAKILSECRYHASLQSKHFVRYHNAWVEFETSFLPNSSTATTKREINQLTTKLFSQRKHFQSTHSSVDNWKKKKSNRSLYKKDKIGRLIKHTKTKTNPSSATTLKSSLLNSSPSKDQHSKFKSGKFWRQTSSSTVSIVSSKLDSEVSQNDVYNKKFEKSSISNFSSKQSDNESSTSNSVQFESNKINCITQDTGEIQFKNFSKEQHQTIVLWSSKNSRKKLSNWRNRKKIKTLMSSSSNLLKHLSPTVKKTQNEEFLDFGIPVLYIQMELCASTLEIYLRHRKTINVKFNKTTMLDLLSAIAFLHKNHLIHRDIKPSNVLLKHRNGRECALLGDFGLTREVSKFNEPSTTHYNSISTIENDVCYVNDVLINSGPKLTGGIGTALYAAPEQICSEDYGPSVDVYSSGIVFYEMFQIFSTEMERVISLTNLRKTSRTTKNFRFEWPAVSNLIKKMISVNPAHRCTPKMLLGQIRRCAENYCFINQLNENIANGLNDLDTLVGSQIQVISKNESSSTNCSAYSLSLNNGEEDVHRDAGDFEPKNVFEDTVKDCKENQEVIQLRKRNSELEKEIQELKAAMLQFKSTKISN